MIYANSKKIFILEFAYHLLLSLRRKLPLHRRREKISYKTITSSLGHSTTINNIKSLKKSIWWAFKRKHFYDLIIEAMKLNQFNSYIEGILRRIEIKKKLFNVIRITCDIFYYSVIFIGFCSLSIYLILLLHIVQSYFF